MHALNSLPGDQEGFSLLSVVSMPATAVIFVHGWGGTARGTWADFPRLLDTDFSGDAWWNGCDVFFYQYPESRTAPLAITASRFGRFLSSVFPKPNSRFFEIEPEVGESYGLTVRPAVQRTADFRYQTLVLVGHSEGAVVIRRSLIEAYKDVREAGGIPAGASGLDTMIGTSAEGLNKITKEFLTKYPTLEAKVVLFAPAHHGANVAGWAGALLNLLSACKYLGPVIDAVRGHSSADYDLSPNSPFLAQLRGDTEKFASIFPSPPALVARSYFGEEDRIVCIGEYQTDLKSVLVPGKNHITICKPNRGYLEPFGYVSHDRTVGKSASGS
jgi:hypothetical protein